MTPGRGLPNSPFRTIRTTSPRLKTSLSGRELRQANRQSRHFPGAAPSSLFRGVSPRAPWDCANPGPNAAPAAAPARADARGARPCALAGYGALASCGWWPWKKRNMLRCRFQRLSAIHLQRGDKSLLRDVDLAELPHLLLAFLLLLQKFALSRDVAAIAVRGDVLAQGAHGFARDDLAADRRLDRNLEHVGRDQLLHLLDHGAAAAFRARLVNQHRERIHRLVVDQDLHLDEIGRLVVGEVIVE